MPTGHLNDKFIFNVARKLDQPEARQEYLKQACADDLELRNKVEALLRGFEKESRFLESSPVELGATLIEPQLLEAPGSQIGSYKICEQLGEGGMGSVYVAEQTEPVRRKVALKLIKQGMDSKEVIVRFEAERQALALMSHPNIAKVLDGGATANGRPYFVMELVKGEPITKFCDDEKLSMRERLDLFVTVCQAVQHAHLKGIIHRDLKPSNVLVEIHDVKPVPKVIDFGIAKATGERLSQHTVYTQFSQLVGTPLYMSPEQAQLSSLDVDSRSDVYSLGVLLYELLTGVTPFDESTLNSVGLDEMRRIIREDEPLRPSAKVSTLGNGNVATISQTRKIDPQRLSPSMRRELDWIVMKALEKDRTRRYESASDLAQDIQRYLDDEPVVACPPSPAYRVRKFAKRHKGVLSAGVLVLLSMLIGLVVSVNLAIRATKSRGAAKQATRDAEQATAELRELLYASDVILASEDWRQNDVEQARRRLARHIPRVGERDLRGFEWHYLWKQHNVSGVEIADTGAAVYDMAISPDGELFAAVGADAKIRVFGVDQRGLRLTIATQQGETNGVAFSPDSRRLATTGDDGTLRIWDLASRRELVNVRAHEGMAYQMAFSPDGRVVATCGEDERVRLWDATDGASLGTLNEHVHTIETIAVSPEGFVAAGDKRSHVTLWDLAQDKSVWEMKGDVKDAVSSVVFSDRGYVACATVGGELTIAETMSRTVVYRRRFANGIQSLAFAPGGLWLAVGDRSGNLLNVPFENGVWNLQATRQWPAHEGRVYCVEVTPDGRRVLSGGADGRIMSWDPLAGGARRAVRFAEECNRVAAVGERQFAVAGIDRIYLCDATVAVVQEFTHTPGYWGQVDFAPQSHQLFAQSVTNVLGWDLTSGAEVFSWELEHDREFQRPMAVVPDGQSVILLVVDSRGDLELGILSVPQGKIVTRLPVSSGECRAVSPDGRWLAFDSDNQISLFDLNRGVVVNNFRGHKGAVRDLCFFSDAERLASVSADRTLKVWSIPDGKLLNSVVAHRTEAWRLAVTADGQRIATGGSDRMLRLWDGRSQQLLWEYPLQRGDVTDLCFTRDDQRLICLCSSNDVVIFDGSPATDFSQNQPTEPDSTDN